MYTTITTLSQLEDSLSQLTSPIIALDTESSGLDYRKSKLEGIGFGTDQETFFLPYPNILPKEQVHEFFTNLFLQKTVIFHHAKYDLEVLAANKLPIPLKIEDTMIMSWLIDENTSHALKQLARDLLGKEPKEWTELKKHVDLFQNEEDIMAELAEYCCDDVVNTYMLYLYLLPKLKEQGLEIAYRRVELKFIPVLCAMEMRGIKVDVSFLQERHKAAQSELQQLETKIMQKIAEKAPKDYKVNLRSPKQLEELLFKIFGYKVVEETESGTASTNAKSLRKIIKKEKLTDEDFLPLMLKFRDLDKVDNTYFVALAQQAGLESTIHCNFLQHGTVTGRIASASPNLQNIPSRNDEWNVRKAFVPRKGYKLVMADYSQLELRIMAHFSGDETMVRTFNEGGDIHAETMRATGASRHQSKTVAFGIIYGMGSRSLAQELGIKEDDAKRYMDRFFRKYHKVKYFIDKTQTVTLKTGWVEMITGRRRHFDEIADKRWWNLIARQAVNSVIQGSASDLVKVAMIKLHPLLKTIGAHMLIQIHDEVIVEVPEDKVEQAIQMIKYTMENALKFDVPMVANITQADRWIKE